MKKSLIALLLVVALVVTVSVFAASAAEPTQLRSDLTVAADGATATGYCPHCDQEVTWTKAAFSTSSHNSPAAGHYFLADSIATKGAIKTPDGDLVIHLNGKTYTRTGDGGNTTGCIFLQSKASKMAIVDSTAGTGGFVATNGGRFVNASGAGTLNVYSGDFTTDGVATNSQGGVMYISAAATVNLYDTTMSGAVASTQGGAFYIGAAAKVTMKNGAEIKNCQAKNAASNQVGGGAVKIYTKTAVFTMEEGSLIENCSAVSHGGAVNVQSGTFKMEGGTIKGCSANTGGAVYLSGNNSKVLMSGGTIKECSATANTGGGAMLIQYGSNLSEISGTALIEDCFAPNGGAITMNGSLSPAITIKGGTIQNCYTTKASGAMGGSIYDASTTGSDGIDGAVINIEDGTISGGSAQDGVGGNIYLKNKNAELNISGGEITKGTALRVNGTSNGSGGNIRMEGGTMNMSGGTISGGLTTNNSTHAGNIYAQNCTLNITGGTITGGRAASFGGNIYPYNATLNIDAAEGKTVTITNGKAAAGANLYIRNNGGDGTYTITGPDVTISGGNATNSNGTGTNPTRAECGSQIALYGDATHTCTLTLTDVAIDSDETHTDEIALYTYAELKVGGTKNIDCAYISDAHGKVTVLPGYTGEMHVRWFDTAIGSAVVPGATVDASLTYEEGYADTGVIKACNASRSGKIASTNGQGGFYIAGFGGFNYNAETKKYEETPLATMPTGENAFDFVRSYLNDGSTIELAANTTLDLNNGVFAIKTNGFQLNLVENRSNEFDYEKGYITVDDETKVNIKTQLANGNQYLVLADKAEGEATKFTAHRVKVDIDSVNIKPATAGLYYTTNMDTTLEASQAAVSYGVVLSLVDMADAGFIADDSNADGLIDNLYTEIDFEKNEEERMSIQGANSALLVGILNQGAPEGQNDAWGSKPIYANAFVCFNIDGKNVYFMADKTYTLSLKDIMELVDGDETLASHPSVVKMYNTWQDPMAQWKLPNIAAAANA